MSNTTVSGVRPLGGSGDRLQHDLLEFFFQIHDPTTKNRQGNDMGASYRSAIYYTSDDQKSVAEDTIADVEASGLWPGKVVTEVTAAGPFWEAEPEHQDYLERYPNGYTCHFPRPNWKLPPARTRADAHVLISRPARKASRTASRTSSGVAVGVDHVPVVDLEALEALVQRGEWLVLERPTALAASTGARPAACRDRRATRRSGTQSSRRVHTAASPSTPSGKRYPSTTVM